MISSSQLNWLRDNSGRIKAYMFNSQFKMVVTWLNAATKCECEVVTELDDKDWWIKVQELDPTARDVT